MNTGIRETAAAGDAATLTRSLEETLILSLLDLINHMNRNAETMASQAGLTVQQWLVLLQVAGDPNFPRPEGSPAGEGLLASEIARDRGVSRANVSPVVSALLRKGLIAQSDVPGDRRRKRLHLTAAGRRAVETVEPVRRQANRKLFADIPRRQLEDCLELAQRCLGRLAARAQRRTP